MKGVDLSNHLVTDIDKPLIPTNHLVSVPYTLTIMVMITGEGTERSEVEREERTVLVPNQFSPELEELLIQTCMSDDMHCA